MQPLSIANVDNLDQTIYISGSGTVFSIETEPLSFLIHTMQDVAGGQSSDDITIRGKMGNNPKWSNLQECLLPTKAIVAFWGALQHFKSFCHANNTLSTCAVVAVHDITYLYNLPREKLKPAAATDSTHVQGNLREQLQTHASVKQDSQSTLSASTWQTKLSKQKAPSSEEEVDEDV
jgi:hypothetical protein